MAQGVHLLRMACFAIVVTVIAANFSALGNVATTFPYEFDSATEGANAPLSSISIVEAEPKATVAALAYLAMSERVNARSSDTTDSSFLYNLGFILDPLGEPSRPVSEPAIPEPSTLFAGIAAGGLVLAFLMHQRRRRFASRPIA